MVKTTSSAQSTFGQAYSYISINGEVKAINVTGGGGVAATTFPIRKGDKVTIANGTSVSNIIAEFIPLGV